jgi:hypothetical protein
VATSALPGPTPARPGAGRPPQPDPANPANPAAAQATIARTASRAIARSYCGMARDVSGGVHS